MQPNDPNQENPLGSPDQPVDNTPTTAAAPVGPEPQDIYASLDQPSPTSQPTPPPTAAAPGIQQPQTPMGANQPQNQPISETQGVFVGQTPGLSQIPNQTQNKNPMTKMVLIIVAVVVVLGLGYLAYHLISSKNTKSNNSNAANRAATSSLSNSSSTGNINSLGSFTFIQPTATQLAGMTVTQPNPSQGIYATIIDASGTSSDVCSISFGNIPQSALPGTDIGSVVANSIARVKQQYSTATIAGPNNIDALVLHGNDGKTYALPTVSYTLSVTSNGTSESSVIDYSVVELKDTSHAIVATQCSGPTSAVSELATHVNSLLPITRDIQIKVK